MRTRPDFRPHSLGLRPRFRLHRLHRLGLGPRLRPLRLGYRWQFGSVSSWFSPAVIFVYHSSQSESVRVVSLLLHTDVRVVLAWSALTPAMSHRSSASASASSRLSSASASAMSHRSSASSRLSFRTCVRIVLALILSCVHMVSASSAICSDHLQKLPHLPDK
jgi:hypothetical protein